MVCCAVSLLPLASTACAADPSPNIAVGPAVMEPAGPAANGAVLPNGRRVLPAGTATPVGLLPLGMALSPDGHWLAVLDDGRDHESVTLIDAASGRAASTQPVDMAFIGILFSQDGSHLYVAGGGEPAVLRFSVDLAAGTLAAEKPIPVPGYPTGLALSPDGKQLYCTENYGNQVAVIDLASGTLVRSLPTGHMPYGVVCPAPGGPVWVSTWADGTVQELSPTGQVLKQIKIGQLAGPLALSRDGRILYVSAVNEDRMAAIDLHAARGAGTTVPASAVRWVSFAPYPSAPPGSVPSALAVHPATGEVYVTLSGLNAVAVVDPVRLEVRGLIPTGWYPSALAISHDGSHLYIAAGKGVGSGPNDISRRGVATSIDGIVYTVALPGGDSFRTQLATWTRQALAAAGIPAHGAPGAGVTARSLHLPPVKHVVYVVKENKTFDQVLGDLGRGDGRSDLTLYGREVTPNTHALADRFAIGDNYYSDGEVSIQGHQWTLGANSPDYTERTWAQVYANHNRFDDSTVSPVSYPGGGYLIRACVQHGVSCRMYGDQVMRDNSGKVLPEIAPHVCPTFRGWDLKYPDVKREAAWEEEFRKGVFPAYSYVWLPDDHTAGTRRGYPRPRAMVADNDLALGRLVETITHSRYWKDTLIFVTEDDSQSGFDHVDAHRNILLVISPWVNPGALTHRHYSQVSISRTIELILGIPPLSQYDAGAAPIADVFASQPDLRPYDAVPESVDMTALNNSASPMARESARLDLSEPDTDDRGLLEKILLADARAATRP